MIRREFITLLGGAAAAWPMAASAQQPERSRRIGVLMGTAESDLDQKASLSVLVEALAALDWIEGRNIRIEYRWAAGDANLLRAHAVELAGLSLDVALAQGTPPTAALRQAAPATPIVFVSVADPVGSGLVDSLARPGGNSTGFANYEITMAGKWLATLKEVAPGVNRVMVLVNPDNAGNAGLWRAMEVAASKLQVQLSPALVRAAADIRRAVETFAMSEGGGLVILADFVTLAHRELIVSLATQFRLPTAFSERSFVSLGGLVSYGIDRAALFRNAAFYVDRILRGGKPADLPVQQPTKFELVVNLKTAKALGLTIPETFLIRADEVIE
jgi:putative tryptophan/tyrosine transport system substrate-binding protein